MESEILIEGGRRVGQSGDGEWGRGVMEIGE